MATKRLNQHRLAVELRMATDAAMTVDPVRGPNRPAMRRVRQLLRDHPEALTKSHVVWNLGNRRAEWLRQIKEARP
jgi:hypothetical protein